MKYEKGQRVKIIGGEGFDYWRNSPKCLGKIATITSENGYIPYYLNDNEWGINFREEWLEPIENNWEQYIVDAFNENLKQEGGESMAEFKIGDRVRLHSGNGHCFVGEATITKGSCLYAKSDRSGEGCTCNREAWELISSAQDIMATFRELPEQAEHWDEDSKALYRVGLVNESLNPEGVTGVVTKALFKLNYAELAEQAREDIKKAEEAKEKENRKGNGK